MTDHPRALSCPNRELAVGWALHALEPAEESMFIEHLPHCSECLDLVAETEEIGATLGLSIPESVPSPDLERRVLAIADHAHTTAAVIPLAQPRTPRNGKAAGFRYRVLSAAAGVVLLATSAVLGVRAVQLDNERDQATQQVMAMTEAMAWAADPDVTLVPLVTEDGRSMGMVLAEGDQVGVMPTALPSNHVHNQIYVLWGLGHDAPVPLADFDVAPDAPVLHLVPSSPDTAEFTGYAVSLEHGRETPAVPSAVMASGQVTS